MLTVHLQTAEDVASDGRKSITFWAVSPGHCKTAFNGFRGTKDAMDGAEVVIQLLESEPGDCGGGTFWEYENGTLQLVPW